MRYLAALLVVLASAKTHAEGFRCGNRLVITGDSVARLSQLCGQPDDTFKARLDIQEGGRARQVTVTQWLYQRRGRKSLVVSVHKGRVVAVERE